MFRAVGFSFETNVCVSPHISELFATWKRAQLTAIVFVSTIFLVFNSKQ